MDLKFIFAEWQNLWIPEIIERELGITLPEKTRKIITFTGIRRSGKTYYMFQQIKKLSQKVSKEQIFYLNFEDERLERKTETLTSLIPSLFELYGDKKEYYLFLDELQVVPEWSKWLRRAYDQYRNITFFVSGSTSTLSAEQIPTELRGRTLNFEIFPFDFNEYLRYKKFQAEKNWEYDERRVSNVKRLLTQYLEDGGFPEVVMEESKIIKSKLIQDYFKTIVNRDIAERHNVKNLSLLRDFLILLLNSKEFSITKTANILRSQEKTAGKETLINYSHYSEESYFCFFVPIFSYKIKDQMKYLKKVYFTDNSFITRISTKFSKNEGRLYENIVAITLKRKQAEDIISDFYYWKDKDGKEVDFVVKKGTKIEQLIQVSYDISDPETKEREVEALLRASKELNCKNLIVIQKDELKDETIAGVKIKYIPLWKWLLDSRLSRKLK